MLSYTANQLTSHLSTWSECIGFGSSGDVDSVHWVRYTELYCVTHSRTRIIATPKSFDCESFCNDNPLFIFRPPEKCLCVAESISKYNAYRKNKLQTYINIYIYIYCVGYMSTRDAVCCFSNARFSSGLSIEKRAIIAKRLTVERLWRGNDSGSGVGNTV